MSLQSTQALGEPKAEVLSKRLFHLALPFVMLGYCSNSGVLKSFQGLGCILLS